MGRGEDVSTDEGESSSESGTALSKLSVGGSALSLVGV